MANTQSKKEDEDSQKLGTYAKARKTGSAKFRTFRREIKTDIRNQHDLYLNNLVGDVTDNPRDFSVIFEIIVQFCNPKS